MVSSTFSLYIHIPFCACLCDYCDFYSVIADDDLMDNYIKALIKDIEFQLDYFNVKEIPSVYIGGGTPSVLGERRISILLEKLNSFRCFNLAEFTIEANPESVTENFLTACCNHGVNRISAGVQTFHEPSKKAVNRKGDIKKIFEKLALISKYFPDSFSADLITGLPYQIEKTIIDDIKNLLMFAPVHVSLYSLSLEEGTPLFEKAEKNPKFLPNQEKADRLWLAGQAELLNAGFNHYEVSNFSLHGKHCAHNMRYWQMENWLGIGASASGTVIDEISGTAKRFTYPQDITSYLKISLITDIKPEILDKSTLIKESLLMGFRCRQGPDPEKFLRRFNCRIEDCIPVTLERWKGRDKLLFLNNFLTEAFIELDNLSANYVKMYA